MKCTRATTCHSQAQSVEGVGKGTAITHVGNSGAVPSRGFGDNCNPTKPSPQSMLISKLIPLCSFLHVNHTSVKWVKNIKKKT